MPCRWQASASAQKIKKENQTGHSSERAVEGQELGEEEQFAQINHVNNRKKKRDFFAWNARDSPFSFARFARILRDSRVIFPSSLRDLRRYGSEANKLLNNRPMAPANGQSGVD